MTINAPTTNTESVISVAIDHIAIPVRVPDTYTHEVLRFFNTIFGFTTEYIVSPNRQPGEGHSSSVQMAVEIPREVKWNGGYARFIINEVGNRIQLNFSTRIKNYDWTKKTKRTMPGAHIALRCNVEATKRRVQEYVDRHEYKPVVEFTDIGDGKFFVSLPTMFGMDFELVPWPNAF